MSSINLLPQELKPNVKVFEMSKKLRSVALIVVVLFLLFLVFYVATSFFLNYRVSSLSKRRQDLEGQIKALQKTEQRLVLVKDRLNKISSVVKDPSANDEVGRLNLLTGLFPENVSVEKVELDKDKAVVAVLSDNLDTVASYLASVVSSGNYVKINLAFLEFDPKKGYTIALSFPE